MSIVTQLNSKKKDLLNADKTNEIISDVKLLLDKAETEDLRIANALGKNHSLAMGQKKVGMQIELKELDEKYAGKVYKVEDIKALCIKYHMRFLQSKHFCGHLDVSALHKIKEFAKETNTEITDGNLNSNFFILAPDESFLLRNERMPRKSDDPAIFYRIDGSHFRLIHKWGNDFTLLRLWKGLMWRSYQSRFLLSWLVAGIILAAPFVYFFSVWFALLALLGVIPSHIYNYKFYDSSNHEKFFTPETWHSDTRYS